MALTPSLSQNSSFVCKLQHVAMSCHVDGLLAAVLWRDSGCPLGFHGRPKLSRSSMRFRQLLVDLLQSGFLLTRKLPHVWGVSCGGGVLRQRQSGYSCGAVDDAGRGRAERRSGSKAVYMAE